MKLTTKLSFFMALLTSLTVIVTLTGSSLSFVYLMQEKAEQQVTAVASMIDIHLVSASPETLESWLNAEMKQSDITEIRLNNEKGELFRYRLPVNLLSKVPDSDLRNITINLIHHPGMRVSLTYQDVIASYFHSMLPVTPFIITLVITLFILLWFLHWLRNALSGQERLEKRAGKILEGERDNEVKSTLPEYPHSVSKALDVLLSDLQIVNEQRNRLDTLIRTFAAQDAKTGLSNRQFFDNQLSILLEEHTQADVHGMAMILRLPDFEHLRELWDIETVEDYQFSLINLLSTFVIRYPGAILARYLRNDCAVLLPHRSLKEANSFASQLLHHVDALPPTRIVDKNNVLHIGICAWCNGQTKEQVMERAEIAVRNAVLQGANNWCIYDESLPDAGRGSVKWRSLLEQTLKQGGPRFYQTPVVNRQGKVVHLDIQCRIFDGKQEILSDEYMPMIEQFGLSEQYDRLIISRLLQLLELWPEKTFAIQVSIDSFIRPSFQKWIQSSLMQCEKSLCSRIIFELAEEDVCQHISLLRPLTKIITSLGGQIAVIHAGLVVASTAYIKVLDIELIKLHPVVVRNISKQTKNQLFLQSLVEACHGTRAHVFASGVRTLNEWQTLINNGVVGAQGNFIAAAQLLDNDVKKYSQRYSV